MGKVALEIVDKFKKWLDLDKLISKPYYIKKL